MRWNNNAWKEYMKTFVNKIGEIATPYLPKNGGNIILAQIENEYNGKSEEYVDWCGQLAESQNFNIPWVMCNGRSANNTINTCNGNNCYEYAQHHNALHPDQPLVWTENEGWQQMWINQYNPYATEWDNRSPQDMAQSVAIWFGAGASHHNYYMYYGGNHLGIWAGSGITNYYTDGVNYHSDGQPHEPKRSHLNKLHKVLSSNQKALLESNIQIGNETYLYSNNITLSLQATTCNKTDVNQQFSYENDLIRFVNRNYCLLANGDSNPIQLSECDANNKDQKWIYTQEKQFKSNENSCLDLWTNTGPNVDEYSCKDLNATGSANQLWSIDGNLIRSNMVNTSCLTAVANVFTYVYQSPYNTSDKLTFLVNMAININFSVMYDNINYFLPSYSVSIIDYQGKELMNTAKVNETGLPTQRIYKTIYSGANDLKFESWNEVIPLQNNIQKRPDKATMNKTPLEQLRFTNYSWTEYLVYSTEFTVTSDDQQITTVNWIGRLSNAYLVWIDDGYQSEAVNYDHWAGNVEFSANFTSHLYVGDYILTILSSSLGVDNYGGIEAGMTADECDKKGIVGNVYLNNYNNSNDTIMDITNNTWYHWIGLTGEQLNVTGDGMNKIDWISPVETDMPLTWYKTTFITPNNSILMNDTYSILVDIGKNGLISGHFYLNGIDMGHYNN
eukprot:1494_1